MLNIIYYIVHIFTSLKRKINVLVMYLIFSGLPKSSCFLQDILFFAYFYNKIGNILCC